MRSSLPKVLHEIAGLPLIGHVLATAHSLAAQHVIAVLRHEKEKISHYISQHFPTTVVADQDETPGTGRAVEAALELLPPSFLGDVLILSGDVPLIDVSSITELIERHQGSKSIGTLVSCQLDKTYGYGRIIRSRGELTGIVEQKDATEEQAVIGEVNAGIYVFDLAQLRAALEKVTTENAAGEKYLTDVVSLMIEKGKVQAHQIADSWLVAGVNDRVQLSEVATELNSRIVRAWQLAGVTIDEPASTWIDITVQIGQDARILPSTRLAGITRIGGGAVIGPDTSLVDTDVGENAVVSRTVSENVRIAANTKVGPFSFLRPGTELGEGGKIGAFVEAKNAKIGPKAKVPHLSYVGDAEIGEGANIGAGTIFANYDGENKHHTKIGKHVRTGSGNVFVAPVVIGDGAYTAAGSTIRKDVDPGALAMNPLAQRNLADWVLDKRPGSDSAEAAKRTE
jgi:bifunctional UDP-N-acetylglucosamine pyrophosphorylase/glucosamine-1-phosphate N-acetyltransferase